MSTCVYPSSAGNSIRRIAFPAEHGGWSLAGEPVVLALIAAPSRAGLFVGIAAMMAFLARQPVKLFLGDLYRGQWFPRSKAAVWIAIVFLALGALALAAAVSLSHAILLWPILFAFPFAAVQIAYDGANESRGVLPEICAATAVASVAAMIALAAGWTNAAYLLWMLAAARSVSAVLYVRERLMMERERRGLKIRREPGSILAAMLSHLALVVLAVSITALPEFQWPLVVAAMLLLARCLHGFSTGEPSSAKQIGFREVAYGVVFATFAGISTW